MSKSVAKAELSPCHTSKIMGRLWTGFLDRIKAKEGIKDDKWNSGEEAMKKRRQTSKPSLQKLRVEGKIRFSLDTFISLASVIWSYL